MGLTDEALTKALGELGYAARKPRHARVSLTFFDTHAGALARAGCTLVYRHRDRTWELTRGDGRECSEPGGARPPHGQGPVALLLGTLTRDLPQCPRLRASVDESHRSVHSSSAAPMDLVVQTWSFQPPFDDSPTADATLVGVAAPAQRGPDVDYLMALLEKRLILQPVELSPAAIGSTLLGLASPGDPPPSTTVPLPADTPAEAGRRLLRRQAWMLRVNRAGALRDVDPEYVHQMRVASRRARFALLLFAPVMGTARCTALREELSWVLGSLGPVRDIDILAERLPGLLARVDASGRVAEALMRSLRARRKTALDAMTAAVGSDRFSALLESLDAPFEPDASPGAPAPASVTAFGRRCIVKALSRVRACIGGSPGALLPAELHRLRILFKRLRYTCEFFSSVCDVGDLIEASTAFQDLLGRYQDASAAIDTLHSLISHDSVRREGVDCALALGALIHVHREARERLRRRFLRLWKARGDALARGKARLENEEAP